MTPRPKKLLDQVRDAIRVKHYAYSTEKTYVHWAKRFVLYHKKRDTLEMGEKEISEFLTYLVQQPHFPKREGLWLRSCLATVILSSSKDEVASWAALFDELRVLVLLTAVVVLGGVD